MLCTGGCRTQDTGPMQQERLTGLEARVKRLEDEVSRLRAEAWAGQLEDRREAEEVQRALLELARVVVGSGLPPAVARLARRDPAARPWGR